MKCIQFTDLHIGLEGQDTFGVDVRKNFRKVIVAIADEQPDYVILTGDLCFREPRIEIYHWIQAQLLEYGVAPLVIAGNHDDRQMMSAAMSITTHYVTGEIFFETSWDGYSVLFLDTAVGSMSSGQWQWLNSRRIRSDRPLVVFMHHPPAVCGVPYMDEKYGFSESSAFQDFVQKVNVPVHVFCGHYHVHRTVSVCNLHIHITPSCFFQIQQENPDFEVDHYRVGYRRIFLTQDAVSSSVVYLD